MQRALGEAALLARATAAHELVRSGAIDGDLALSLVVWPTKAIEAAMESLPRTRTKLTRADVERIFELRAAGLSCSAVAKRLSRPKATITGRVAIGQEEAMRGFVRNPELFRNFSERPATADS